MKCFYHNDADGQMSAMWVYAHVGIDDEYEPDFISIDYKDTFPIETIKRDEQIYIVDFSIQPTEMLDLLKISKNITWIDHHKTSIERYADFPYQLRGVRYDGVAGCELTFAYIHHMTQRGIGSIKKFNENMLLDCPMHTRFIGDRDVWAFKFGDDTRSFYDGYQLLDSSNIDNLVNLFIFENVNTEKIIQDGKTISKFKEIQREYVIKSYAQEVKFEGYDCLVCNSHDKTSELFGSKFNDYDLCSVYCFDGNKYTVSLYSQKVDVSEIAKKYGGGGHKGAAGFVCDKVPYISV